MSILLDNIDIIRHLKEKHSPFYSTIDRVYELSKTYLSEIPKTFSNYTLHDIEHSVRVIRYMNEFVKNKLEVYSDLHLALIVYAGLLHDTGMVVSDNEETELYNVFEKTRLDFLRLSSEEKKEYLREFVRKNHGKRVHGFFDLEINADASVRGLFYAGDTSSYDLSQLIGKICQSHTESSTWIAENLDKELHIADYVVNPQHIAILLRIGDALDIDDRRAPWILYKFLNPQGTSDAEWRKHIPIRNYDKVKCENDRCEILFSGECSEPSIYRKVLEYIDWLNTDIENLNLLLNGFDEKYKFKIETPIKVEIKTCGFVETPLRFNLSYEQISNLLMGEKIYGSKRDGLRELLQNAIDTVRLIEEKEKKKVYSTYTPTIGIEINEKENQFIVFDNGAGMSKEILEKYFFNIGNSYYVSNEFKEEMCEYNPIGHFGIGFLACFMLAPKVRLETRDYRTSKVIHMDFEKNSPYVTMYDYNGDDFPFPHGTRIIMDYDKIVPEVFKDVEDITTYIKKLLLTYGYRFRFIYNGATKNIELNSPKNVFKVDRGEIEHECKFVDLPKIKFEIPYFFEDNESVYLIDMGCADLLDDYQTSFVGLAYLIESIEELNTLMRKYDGDIERVKDEMEESASFPFVLMNIVWREDQELAKYYDTNDDIYGYFNSFFNSYVKNNLFEWYNIPIILQNDLFYRFLEDIEEYGYERALEDYKGSVKFISVVCNGELNDEVILDIVESFLNCNDSKLSINYFEAYPIPLIKKSIELIKGLNHEAYLIANRDYKISESYDCKIYLKGIRVVDKNIVLPHIIEGTNIKDLFLNIKSDRFDTDVSRQNFDKASKELLSKCIGKIIYQSMLENYSFTDEETDLIKTFLKIYYN